MSTVELVQVHTMAPPGNVWMDCPTDENFAFVKIQTLSGHIHATPVRVVTIQTERAGMSRCPKLSKSRHHSIMMVPTQLRPARLYESPGPCICLELMVPPDS